MRVSYRLGAFGNSAIGMTGRLSRPIGSSGGEAAPGLSFRPSRHWPVEIIAERRIAIERGGRNAWALGVAGGLSRRSLLLGLELDAYGQAGIVGVQSRDLYGEGAVGIARPLDLPGPATLSLGGEVRAAAQPGAERVDIGPEAILRMPVGEGALRLSVGWRQCIAGDARPGSGIAVTAGADF